MKINNPETAPFVPIESSIEVERNNIDDEIYLNYGVRGPLRTTITIKAWDRKKDSVLTYKVTLTGQDQGTLMESSLDENDIEWLRNIGARD